LLSQVCIFSLLFLVSELSQLFFVQLVIDFGQLYFLLSVEFRLLSFLLYLRLIRKQRCFKLEIVGQVGYFDCLRFLLLLRGSYSARHYVLGSAERRRRFEFRLLLLLIITFELKTIILEINLALPLGLGLVEIKVVKMNICINPRLLLPNCMASLCFKGYFLLPSSLLPLR